MDTKTTTHTHTPARLRRRAVREANRLHRMHEKPPARAASISAAKATWADPTARATISALAAKAVVSGLLAAKTAPVGASPLTEFRRAAARLRNQATTMLGDPTDGSDAARAARAWGILFSRMADAIRIRRMRAALSYMEDSRIRWVWPERVSQLPPIPIGTEWHYGHWGEEGGLKAKLVGSDF